MATLKYSRQRECIKEYLMHTTEHPTADTVYEHVKEEFPRISLGTVYRNLNRNVYWRYEKGEREIPVWALIKLADYYRVSTDYLLGLTDDPARR